MMHVDLLRLLLPPSSIDPMGPALSVELVADGNVLDLAQSSGDQILLEADPRTTAAMLADWERIYGLPEAYISALGTPQSFQERRTMLVAKVTMQGGQTKAFFIALAAAIGYAITITECMPATTEYDTESPIYDEQYRFLWFVNAPSVTVRELTSEDDTEMATAVWGNALLEAIINRYKPAHTLALFAYS
jgi:uncharacterized protein YmfQ (DUF2313 family)